MALQIAVERVEGVVGVPSDESVPELVVQMSEHGTAIQFLEKVMKDFIRSTNDRFNNSWEDMLTMTNLFGATFRNLEGDVALLKRAVSQGSGSDGPSLKIKCLN